MGDERQPKPPAPKGLEELLRAPSPRSAPVVPPPPAAGGSSSFSLKKPPGVKSTPVFAPPPGAGRSISEADPLPDSPQAPPAQGPPQASAPDPAPVIPQFDPLKMVDDDELGAQEEHPSLEDAKTAPFATLENKAKALLIPTKADPHATAEHPNYKAPPKSVFFHHVDDDEVTEVHGRNAPMASAPAPDLRAGPKSAQEEFEEQPTIPEEVSEDSSDDDVYEREATVPSAQEEDREPAAGPPSDTMAREEASPPATPPKVAAAQAPPAEHKRSMVLPVVGVAIAAGLIVGGVLFVQNGGLASLGAGAPVVATEQTEDQRPEAPSRAEEALAAAAVPTSPEPESQPEPSEPEPSEPTEPAEPAAETGSAEPAPEVAPVPAPEGETDGGADEAPPDAEPAEPPPAAETEPEVVAGSAEDLVAQAQSSFDAGDHQKAYDLAKQGYDKRRYNGPLEMMAKAACMTGDAPAARVAFRGIVGREPRKRVREVCLPQKIAIFAEGEGWTAKEQLARAREAQESGDFKRAYELAKDSNEKKRRSEALQVMGLCACELGDEADAKKLAQYVKKDHRVAITKACSAKGITLD